MIFGKVGRIGHGKTMRAVVDAVALARRRGAVLAANIRIRPPEDVEFVLLPMDGFSEALGTLMDDCRACEVCTVRDEWWGDVAHGEPGCERRGLVVLVDEVDTIWDAREWQDMSKLDRFRIKQSRKLGCDLIWTAQFVDQVEKGLRNITEEAEWMRAIPSPSIERRERGRRPWFLVGQRFRPGAIREITGSPDPDKRLGRSIYRYRREHERLYNTDDLVRPAEMEEPRRRRRSASSSMSTGQSRSPDSAERRHGAAEAGPPAGAIRSAAQASMAQSGPRRAGLLRVVPVHRPAAHGLPAVPLVGGAPQSGVPSSSGTAAIGSVGR